jgi:hypothetical protein
MCLPFILKFVTLLFIFEDPLRARRVPELAVCLVVPVAPNSL